MCITNLNVMTLVAESQFDIVGIAGSTAAAVHNRAIIWVVNAIYCVLRSVRFISFHLIPNYLTNTFNLEEKLFS